MIRNNPDLDALLDKAAAEMGLTAENVTPEHLTALRQVVEDAIGEDAMRDSYTVHREATYAYLNATGRGDTLAAVMAVRECDPAGIISVLGTIVTYWADLLRDDTDTRESMPAGDMARITFDALLSMEAEQDADDAPVTQ